MSIGILFNRIIAKKAIILFFYLWQTLLFAQDHKSYKITKEDSSAYKKTILNDHCVLFKPLFTLPINTANNSSNDKEIKLHGNIGFAIGYCSNYYINKNNSFQFGINISKQSFSVIQKDFYEWYLNNNILEKQKSTTVEGKIGQKINMSSVGLSLIYRRKNNSHFNYILNSFFIGTSFDFYRINSYGTIADKHLEYIGNTQIGYPHDTIVITKKSLNKLIPSIVLGADFFKHKEHNRLKISFEYKHSLFNYAKIYAENQVQGVTYKAKMKPYFITYSVVISYALIQKIKKQNLNHLNNDFY